MTPELEQAIQAEAQLQGYTGEHLHALRRGAELSGAETAQWQDVANRWMAVSNDQMRLIEALKQERDELRRRMHELASAILSINKAKRHEITIGDDDEPCYWQRKEWVEWIVDMANQIEGGE